MKAYERLLKYVAINTPCDGTSNTTPSSKCQFDLANLLKDEMHSNFQSEATQPHHER